MDLLLILLIIVAIFGIGGWGYGTYTTRAVPATAVAPAVVDAVLPPGLAYAGVAAPWTCTSKPAGAGTLGLHCTDPSLGARATTTLLLSLRGDQPVQGQVQLQLGPAANQPAGVVTFGFSVVTPS